MWKDDGGNFMGFEICHKNIGSMNLAIWHVCCGIPLISGVEMVACEWGDLQPQSFEGDDVKPQISYP